MTTTEKIIIGILGAILFAAGLFSSLMFSQKANKFGDINGQANYLKSMTNTAIQVGPQNSVRILATSTARTFVQVTATTTAYCNLSDVPATINGGGISLGLAQPLVINSNNLYIGSIQCEAPASTTLSVMSSQ